MCHCVTSLLLVLLTPPTPTPRSSRISSSHRQGDWLLELSPLNQNGSHRFVKVSELVKVRSGDAFKDHCFQTCVRMLMLLQGNTCMTVGSAHEPLVLHQHSFWTVSSSSETSKTLLRATFLPRWCDSPLFQLWQSAQERHHHDPPCAACFFGW